MMVCAAEKLQPGTGSRLRLQRTEKDWFSFPMTAQNGVRGTRRHRWQSECLIPRGRRRRRPGGIRCPRCVAFLLSFRILISRQSLPSVIMCLSPPLPSPVELVIISISQSCGLLRALLAITQCLRNTSQPAVRYVMPSDYSRPPRCSDPKCASVFPFMGVCWPPTHQ